MWVTIEGVNGVGKTYLAHALADQLDPQCALVTELTDGGSGDLPKAIISALSERGDFFLRTGAPITETFALLALKVYEYERLRAQAPRILLEDRGVDTVALYQAAILADPEADLDEIDTLAQRIYRTATHWRPLPDLTLLVTDQLEVCLTRLTQREGISLPGADRNLICTVDRLYRRQAEREPHRWRVIDRTGRDTGDVVAAMHDACLNRLPTTPNDR
jgi:dTMP kinase